MFDWEALSILSAAHVAGLEKLARLEQAAVDLQNGRVDDVLDTLKDSMAFFGGELERHFRHEELALFPAMAKVIGRAGPVGAMLAEHESIWNAIEHLTASVEELVEDGPTLNEVTAHKTIQSAKHVVFLLRGHIQREDTMLFPLADSTLDEEGKREVDGNIEVIERETDSSRSARGDSQPLSSVVDH